LSNDIDYWLKLAEYDFETAKAMLETGRYVYVLFMCQQALEKILKAHVVRETKEFPPRLHNLLRLAVLSNISISDENKIFLEKLNYYYLESRYPEDREKISRTATFDLTKYYYEKTKEVFEWLKTK